MLSFAFLHTRILALLTSILMMGVGTVHAAPKQRTSKVRHTAVSALTQRIVPVERGQLSPDGRWLAFFSTKKAQFNLYNFATKRTWPVLLKRDDGEAELYASDEVAWHPQSRMLVVATSSGWLVLWPYQKKQKRITNVPPRGECSAAWAQQGTRLALFESFFSGGHLRLWNGRKVTDLGEWRKLVGYPQGEERAWQSEWSPDGKKLLFRYYGHAERDKEAPGHTCILDPRTGHPLYNWGAEATPAHWIDNDRLISITDNGMYEPGGSTPLTVSKPRAGIDNVWSSYTLWTLSPHRDTIYALDTANGLLRSTSSRVKQWRTRRRLRLPRLAQNDSGWGNLQISPRGDWLTIESEKRLILHHLPTGRTFNWQSSADEFRLVGWANNRALPMVALRWGYDTPWQVRQLSVPNNASRQ